MFLPLLFFMGVGQSYWFELHRASNKELLYYGIAGDRKNSVVQKVFTVKTGIPGKKPTPLPSIVGKQYWKITQKFSSQENPETSPYFLTLDIPVSADEPYGPEPYLECNGQCNWEIPGYFGLHGVGGDMAKLASDNAGSSGCIRHSDTDITYLYNVLDPNKNEIRYYISES